MSEPIPEYTTTIDGTRFWYEDKPDIPDYLRAWAEQRRRAVITELRALDTLLGRTQTIPRKER